MKTKTWLTSGSVLMAAWMTSGVGFAQSSGSDKNTIHPEVSGPAGSVGGSQSERSGDSGVPLPQGSRQSGTVEMGKSGAGSFGSAESIKQIQQSLKDKGYDPGPINGVLDGRTKDALKSFQSASNLQPTGTINSETAAKLGVQSGVSSSSSNSSSRNNAMKSSDTTVGKDTDQPNQPPKMK